MKFILLFTTILLTTSLLAQSSNWADTNSQSVIFYNSGDFEKAIQWADEALQIAETTYGKKSDPYITSLENKSHSLAALGNYLKAVKLSQQSVELSLALYNKPHQLHLETLYGLAKNYLNLSHYDSAEYQLNQANYLFGRMPKENKAHYDSAIWNIAQSLVKIRALEATLYHRKGLLSKAINILETQLEWMQVTYPNSYEKLDDYQTTLNNLGTYYNEANLLEQSKACALRYFALLDQYDGKAIDRINALQNIGSLYRSLENYDSAFYYQEAAIADLKRQGIKQSKLYVILMNNLGTLHLDVDQMDSAIWYLNKAKELQEAKPSVDSRIYKNTLYNLAEAYRWSGNYRQADKLYTQLIELVIDDINHNFTYLSDAEKLSFYKNQLQFINDYKAFALEISGLLPLQDSDEPYVNSEVAGRLYNLQLSTKAAILNASRRMRNSILNSGDTALIAAFTYWEYTKNRLANQHNDQGLSEQEKDSLNQLVEFYEKWLITNSAHFRSGFQQEEIIWKDIQQQLHEGEVAIELIRLVDGLAYAALILTPNTVDQPLIALILGKNMKYLEKEFFANYRNAITFKQEDTISYKIYWEPISKVIMTDLGRAPERIYVSNDGIYNQINLNTLYNPKTGKYLLDETDIHLLTNTKELLSSEKNTQNNRTAILLGNPEFAIHKAKGYAFTPLPGAAEEVKAIETIMKSANWEAKTFTGAYASEQKLNSLQQPGILHIASHGYFMESQFQESVSQLLNSGIVLASDGLREDGFLTAYEVMTHNYDATELVVLSACETGLGAVNQGEGVYGLQRALQVAGAENIIMSLWKVNDEATRILMTSFYRYLIKDNDIRLAFLKAQQVTRTIYPDPYYWGAFILAGK